MTTRFCTRVTTVALHVFEGKLSKQVFVEQLVNPEYVKLDKPWGVVFQTEKLFRVPKVGYAHFQLLFVLCLWSRLTDFVNTGSSKIKCQISSAEVLRYRSFIT